MSPSVGITVVLYSLLLATLCLVAAARGRPRGAATSTGLIVLEAGVVLQAAVDALALVRHLTHAEVATNVGYLLTSVAVLPVAASSVRLDAGRWGSTAMAVGCLLVAVVTLRLHQTLGVPGAG